MILREEGFVRKFFLLVLICSLVIVCSVSQSRAQWFLFQNPLLGKQAKEFSLQDMDGRKQSLSDLRKGAPVIIFFWATWCPHCVNQLADLQKHADLFSRKNIRLILVDLGEDAQKVGNFLARRGLSFDMILFDSDGAVANDYGVQGVPTYIFIGRNGVVKAVDHRLLRDYERILLGEE